MAVSSYRLRAPDLVPRGRQRRLDGPLPWALGAGTFGGALGLAAALGGASAAIGVALLPLGVALVLRPEWLPVVLMITVFSEAYSIGGVSISRAAGPIALVILALHARRGGAVSFRGLDRRLAVLIAAYSFWAIASSLWTVNFDSTLQEGGTAFAVSSLLLSAIYLVAVATLVTDERHALRIVVTVWALGSVMGLVAIGEFVSGSQRAVGASGDANFFAALQIVVIPIGAVLVGFVRTNRQRAVVLVGVGIAVGSVLVTLSRGGVLALVAIALLLAMQPARGFFRSRARKRLFLMAMAIGVAILLSASYSALSARTSSLFDSSDGGSGRANLWRAAGTAISEKPVLGLGFGAFTSQANDLLRETPGVDFSAYRLRVGGQPVHNAYLESLAELGPLGLLLFVAMLGSVFAALRRSRRRAIRAGSPFAEGLSRALSLSLIGFALTSLALSTETDRTLWVLMALALTLPRIAARTQTPWSHHP